jgi:hypothetical protein
VAKRELGNRDMMDQKRSAPVACNNTKVKGTVGPDWIYMRVMVPLDSP